MSAPHRYDGTSAPAEAFEVIRMIARRSSTPRAEEPSAAICLFVFEQVA